jgi:putative ABC transport system permease protein
LPGVRTVSLARIIPLNGSNMKVGINIPGRDLPSERGGYAVGLNIVDARYFETVGMPLLAGRTFSDTDKQGAPLVAIVNETMARRLYPGPDVSTALGQSFTFGDGRGSNESRIVIVGIAKDAKYDTLGEDPQPFIYRPFQQSYSGEMTLHIRTMQSDAGNVLAAVRREVGVLDKDLPLLDAMSMTEQIGFSLLPLKLAATVAGSLGFLGALLAALGVFGVVNYTVTQRTRELGIRMSLGAQSRDVLRLILRQGLLLALIGISIGLTAAAALTRMLTSLLYGVSALEPMVFGGVAVLLMAMSLLASYLPARRATKVDPLVALRYE